MDKSEFSEHHDIAAAIAAGMEIGDVKRLTNGGQFAIVPDGATVRDLNDIDNPDPAFVKASVTARTPAALVAYMRRHGDAGSSIFADISTTTVRGIVDYHGADNVAGRCVHQVVYKAPHSNEWNLWAGMSGKDVKQADMARFLEENRRDVVAPPGADLLEIVKTLEAIKKVDFRSGVRLDNGTVDLLYKEVVDGVAGADGKLTIPTEISLGIPVFYGGQPYAVTMFFRYYLNGGNLSFKLEMHRRQEILDAAFDDIVNGIKGELPDVPLYEGSVAAVARD